MPVPGGHSPSPRRAEPSALREPPGSGTRVDPGGAEILRWAPLAARRSQADKLHIRRTLSTADGKRFGTPKGGREESIDLHPELRRALYALPSRFGGPDAPVFQTKHGGRHLHPRTVMDAFALARAKALSDKPRTFRFHDLRHSCASRLVNGGLPAT